MNIFKALQDNQIDLVISMLNEELDINTINTLLHVAAYKGCDRIISELIKRGININAADKDGWTALHSCLTGNIDIVKLLIDNGAIIMSDNYGNTPVTIARRHGYDNIVNYLEFIELTQSKN